MTLMKPTPRKATKNASSASEGTARPTFETMMASELAAADVAEPEADRHRDQRSRPRPRRATAEVVEVSSHSSPRPPIATVPGSRLALVEDEVDRVAEAAEARRSTGVIAAAALLATGVQPPAGTSEHDAGRARRPAATTRQPRDDDVRPGRPVSADRSARRGRRRRRRTRSVARPTVVAARSAAPARISGSASGSSTRHRIWLPRQPHARGGVDRLGRHVAQAGGDVAER